MTDWLNHFVMVISYLNLHWCLFKLLKLITDDGDVESNPGPTTYQILKSIQGTFHQGNVIMFGKHLTWIVF